MGQLAWNNLMVKCWYENTYLKELNVKAFTMLSKIQKDLMALLYTSGFATTHVVVFLWVCIAGDGWGEEDN